MMKFRRSSGQAQPSSSGPLSSSRHGKSATSSTAAPSSSSNGRQEQAPKTASTSPRSVSSQPTSTNPFDSAPEHHPHQSQQQQHQHRPHTHQQPPPPSFELKRASPFDEDQLASMPVSPNGTIVRVRRIDERGFPSASTPPQQHHQSHHHRQHHQHDRRQTHGPATVSSPRDYQRSGSERVSLSSVLENQPPERRSFSSASHHGGYGVSYNAAVHQRRSLSVQRASLDNTATTTEMRILGTASPTSPASSQNSDGLDPTHRSNQQYQQRSQRPMSVQRPMQTPEAISESSSPHPSLEDLSEHTGGGDASAHSGDNVKQRKSKLEKIKQLQAKNELYKDEFKRVQKDRKQLKKELEEKRLEVASLTKEIDAHIADTSVLKMNLSEALQQLEKKDYEERRDKGSITKLSKELAQAQTELVAATNRATHLREEVESLQESVKRKDEQIHSLTAEVAEQVETMESMRQDLLKLQEQHRQGLFVPDASEDKMVIEELVEENKRLQGELGGTLERASVMVKEREDAIADLLKENDEMKKMLAQSQKERHTDDVPDATDANSQVLQAELDQMKEELQSTATALEEAQDRNLLLEEDLEAWIARGREMEADIDRLRDEVCAWEQKAAASEEAVAVVEKSAKEAQDKAKAAETALAQAEARHKQQLVEAEMKIGAAENSARLISAKLAAQAESDENASRASANLSETSSSKPDDAQDKQAMLLQAAVAKRQVKAEKGSTWGNMLSGLIKQEEELDPQQKRIKELEAANADQEEELTKLKSEMVRLRSNFNETMYVNKKKVENLEQENNAFQLKIAALERELEEARKSSQLLEASQNGGDNDENQA